VDFERLRRRRLEWCACGAQAIAAVGRSASPLDVIPRAFTSFFAVVDLPLASWAL